MRALAKGDGFSEKASEPASLDELLTLRVPETATGAPTEEAVAPDLAGPNTTCRSRKT